MKRKHRTQANIFRWVTLFLSATMLFLTQAAMPQDDINRRKAYLEQLQRVLPKSPPWEEWLQKSGELPPDFANMPSSQGVLQPLTREINGKRAPISTRAAWEQDREEIKTLLHQWILGSVPPAPGNIEAKVLGERKETHARAREVELRFGPDHKAKLWCELLIPAGSGPFPVFLTQENHRAWALVALQRGYLACVYAGCDARDDGQRTARVYRCSCPAPAPPASVIWCRDIHLGRQGRSEFGTQKRRPHPGPPEPN